MFLCYVVAISIPNTINNKNTYIALTVGQSLFHVFSMY